MIAPYSGICLGCCNFCVVNLYKKTSLHLQAQFLINQHLRGLTIGLLQCKISIVLQVWIQKEADLFIRGYIHCIFLTISYKKVLMTSHKFTLFTSGELLKQIRSNSMVEYNKYIIKVYYKYKRIRPNYNYTFYIIR